jgi:hypothetical protein
MLNSILIFSLWCEFKIKYFKKNLLSCRSLFFALEGKNQNSADAVFPHFVGEKNLTGLMRFGTTAFGYFAKQNSFLSQISNPNL